MAVLTKHKTVLHIASVEESFLDGESNVRFSCAVPEGGESQPRTRELLIRKELWIELGQPGSLTLSIRSGDALNEG